LLAPRLQLFSFAVLTKLPEQFGIVANAGNGIRVVGAEHLFSDSEGTTEQKFGFRVSSLVAI
jgi:hypothetical protein